MNKANFNLTFLFRKEIFSKKSTRLLIEVVGSLLGLTFLILFGLLGRLSMGPIQLDFLTPQIEEAFKSSETGLSAKIAHTQLVWREWKRPFEIELLNVNLQKDKNPNWLKIEHIGVSLRLYRLLIGEASLKQLRFYQPQILLEKDAAGQFSLGFGESNTHQEFGFKEIAPFLALGGSHPALGKLNELNKISIIDAHVTLKDTTENKTWVLPKTSFALKRHRDGFHTTLTLNPQQGDGDLTLELVHRIESSRLDVSAEFDQVSFRELFEKKGFSLCTPQSEITQPDDLLNFLQCWSAPLDGKIHLAFVPENLQLIEGECDLNLGKGELDLSLAKLFPLPITSGNISFRLSPNKIDLTKVSFLSNEMHIDLSGALESPSTPLLLTTLLNPGQTLELQGTVEDLLLDHLSALWPQGLAGDAREWVTKNLKKGTLTQATFSLKGHGKEDGFSVDQLKGTLHGERAEITYLDGLPPAQNVEAHATFDQKGFDIKILSGEVKHIKLQEGRVLISNLDTNHEALSLKIKAQAPLSDILDVINHKPLEYASSAGIDPKKTTGEGNISLSIDFPLLADLHFKDVKMAVQGTFKKVALERKITETLKAQLAQGDFFLDLTQDHMAIKGKGILNQLPASLTYEHFFHKTAPHELQIKVETQASFKDFKRFGFDYQEYAQGPTHTILTYTLEKNKNSKLLMNLDITPSTLSFLPLEWKKKAGEKGHLSFVLLFENGNLSMMRDLIMVAPPYSLRGNVHFGAQKNWETIQLSEFKGPHTHTQVTLHNSHPNTYEVSFKGKSVDVENFLKYVNEEETTKNHPPTNIKLSADVQELRMGEDKIFESVKASAHVFLHGSNTTWKEVHLRAKAGKGTANKGDMAHVSGGILFDIKPGPQNTQTVEVRANDAGKFLKNLSIYEEIRRGYITVKGTRKGLGPYKGVFKLKQFDAREVPLLARFAALLSPMGIVNLFSEKKTLSMDRFECDFEFSEDLVTVKKGIGKSMSLGFTTEGKLDRKNRLFSLKGNIIPARFLNSILSNIPLIGSLINGGEGEGLFAIAYTVKGSFDAPDVILNPLSALAPGFIRKLFQSLEGNEE